MTDEQSAAAAPPPVVYLQPEGRGRSGLWALLGVALGFLLPMFSCLALSFLFVLLVVAAASGASDQTRVRSTGVGDAVAIVRVRGAITSGALDDLATGAVSGVVIADLERAAADPSVKAIVLAVDSPGGTVTGSAEIYEVVRDLEKPVVVSMVSVAASGGYYISAPADFIYARPDTITGSIGVIYTLINAEELLVELGVEVNTLTSGPNKDFGNLWRDLTPEQRQILELLIAESYAEFVRVVADGRGMTVAEVQGLADGRIYSGRQAAANGLVDELGNLNHAIAKAADLGGIRGEPRVIEYLRQPSLAALFQGLAGRLQQSEVDQIQLAITELTTPALEYRYVAP